MNRILKSSLLLSLVVMFSSCGSVYNSRSARAISLEPDVVRLDMNLSEFEYQGSVDVSVEYRTYLGIIKSIDKVNGEPYAGSRETNSVSLSGPKHIFLGGPIQKALYKVVEAYPDADYYVPTVKKNRKVQLFLGSSNSSVVTFKVYNFNR